MRESAQTETDWLCFVTDCVASRSVFRTAGKSLVAAIMLRPFWSLSATYSLLYIVVTTRGQYRRLDQNAHLGNINANTVNYALSGCK